MKNTKKCIAWCICIVAIVFVDVFAISNSDQGISQRAGTLAIPIPFNATSPYTIIQPGCYRLTDNMTDFQIIIASSDVAVILNGYCIDNQTLASDAIVINAGLDDIIIRGGTILGNNISNFAGIRINDNCSNVAILELKISNEFNGITCVPGTGSDDVTVKEVQISNCDYGVYASNPQNLRLKQNVICSPLYTPSSETTAIYLENATGTIIDGCYISFVNWGVQVNNSSASKIRDCTIQDLSEIQPNRAGIILTAGTANIVENCLISDLSATATGGLFGIVLDNEIMSVVNKCFVNHLYPAPDVTIYATGISVLQTTTSAGYCIVQDNSAANIIGNSLTTTSYGFELLDTASTLTNSNFINNHAINCIQPYTTNIINTATNPQPTDYLWNWIF